VRLRAVDWADWTVDLTVVLSDVQKAVKWAPSMAAPRDLHSVANLGRKLDGQRVA
jgi:hypothetical protein